MATAPHITIRGDINSRYEMRRAGYKYLGSNHCKACGAPIEWWLTTKGHKMPFDPIADDECQTETHWRTCPRAADFRKPKGSATTAPSYTPATKPADQVPAMQREVEALCGKYNLRAVVLLHDGGRVFSYRFGIPGEDLRNEIIAAANDVRNAVTKAGR